jgi:DNA processing protein
LGIDALAHKTALDAGLYTLAVPGSGLNDEVIYPRTNRALARRILESGGGLLSEFEPSFNATPWSFPQRNRIMVGLSHAVLLIEASLKSGTLITARLASDYNRDLLAVPGDIFSDSTKGTHQFIKLGATPITTPEDIIEALHLEVTVSESSQNNLTQNERLVIDALKEPRERDEVLRLLPLHETETLALLMRMELDGKIREQNGVLYKTL